MTGSSIDMELYSGKSYPVSRRSAINTVSHTCRNPLFVPQWSPESSAQGSTVQPML